MGSHPHCVRCPEPGLHCVVFLYANLVRPAFTAFYIRGCSSDHITVVLPESCKHFVVGRCPQGPEPTSAFFACFPGHTEDKRFSAADVCAYVVVVREAVVPSPSTSECYSIFGD